MPPEPARKMRALRWQYQDAPGHDWKKACGFLAWGHVVAMKRIDGLRVERGALKGILALLCLSMAASLFAATGGEKEETVKLREVSVFEQGQDAFLAGQSGTCNEKPNSEVKAYPKFRSAKPIYGSVKFGGKRDDPATGRTYYYALDESEGTGKGYDRLYFDLNRDLDLRNDPILKPQSHAPKTASLKYSSIQQQVVFDFFDVDFDFGPAGTRPVQLMPRFYISKYDKEEYPQMSFVRTRVCEGEVRIGGSDYNVLIGNDRMILGRLDDPGSALFLILKKSSEQARWWGGNRLSGIQKIAGQFYALSATPTGDQLTVHPYHGDLGTFKLGPGTRALTNFNLMGSIEGRDCAVPVGGDITNGWPIEASSCQVPVGDYLPEYLKLQFGRLGIFLSQNYHSEGKRQNRAGRPSVYGITIRKDQPYVLDFSNKPEVMFTSPAKDQRVKPGDTIEVMAVLVDPKLDIMIRGLEDTSHKQTKDAEGKALGYERNLSLDPTVIITRTNGEKVAAGVMPFG
jgi:hypothetical protein